MPMQPDREDFVRVVEIAPGIIVELKYATEDNFTGRAFYSFSEAWLRRGTAEKLGRAQEALQRRGYGLKLWDAFRPVEAQFVLWEACPDDTFVANPYRGFSAHSRGNAVDVTLVDEGGAELKMPSAFDCTCWKENRDAQALENYGLLRRTMEQAGFRPYEDEWWHFYDLDQYEVEQNFRPPEGI